MLQIRFSNRFEVLQEALLEAMAAPPASPFAPEEIIVPSIAIRRRIEIAAAERFGLCCNVAFSFLAQWLWRQIGHVVAVPEVSPFTASVLAWRVFALFGRADFVADHPPLELYLREADGAMRYELAARTAALLEQYLAYRPDWLAAWLAGRSAREPLDAAARADERWQAALWRRIAGDLGTGRRHPSVAFFDALDALGPAAPRRAGLPLRAHLFCLPATPPLYLDILQRLGQWIDLTLYVMNPCAEYWFEIVDPRRLSYLAARGGERHHEAGNRLLAAWGGQAQAHIDLLLGSAEATVIDDAHFERSPGTTLLAQVQNAVLDLTDLAPGSIALEPEDRSIEVHLCHSLTRELDVLHDQLLMLFAGPDPPRPSDILVVVPDLQAGAPLIDAVFGNAPAPRAIPYVITGRPASARNPCARALLAILDVATSRFPASAVFELLQQPVIARRFDIGDLEREAIHDWIRAAGIRWGIDGAHRQALDLPAVARNTFEDGLDRLFLGYALPAGATEPFDGRLAAGEAEGSPALALGSFGAFVAALAGLHHRLARPQTPAAWQRTLLDAVDAFLLPSDDEIDDLRETVARVNELWQDMVHGETSEPLSIDVARIALAERLDDPTRGGIPTGAVTFAAMTSLRHLPFRFIGVLGLNDGAYPSLARPLEFDLMARAPRRGDRQRRVDERSVFLDLLLAARERLYLSYTGRSVRDNSPLPPSMLVAELLDYLAPAIRPHPRERLLIVHPLQPFDLAYFEPGGDGRRRSFNDEYCNALMERLGARRAPSLPLTAGSSPGLATAEAERDDAGDADADADAGWQPQERFFREPLPAAGAEFRELAVDDLASFFGQPCRYLLQARLGIKLPQGDEELQDDEAFRPDWRARDALARRTLPRLLAGEPLSALTPAARAGVDYPAGALGDIELERELRSLDDFARELRPSLAEPLLAPVNATLDLAIDGETWRLSGGFSDLRRHGRIAYRYADVRVQDYLRGWIAHLFLNALALAPAEVTATTAWHSRDGRYVLRPVDDAPAQLASLVALYRDGLQRPLHFFPRSAWAFMREGQRPAKALAAWRGASAGLPGESREAAYALALRGIDNPLDAAFERCARLVFAPLLACIDDARLA